MPSKKPTPKRSQPTAGRTESRPVPSQIHFPVVGVGASAGGLEALQAFFDAMPNDTGMAFVVVTHQLPGHASLLPELLGRHTTMPVAAIDDRMAVLPDRIYVSPPGKRVAILDGALHLTDLVRDGKPKLPIDFFLRSLARELKQRAVCIVLSGTGTDGTLGLRAIKSDAGMAMVQDEHSARYAGMPQSAAATLLADYVLAPELMPQELVAYVRRSGGAASLQDTTDPRHDGVFKHIFGLLHRRTGQDFGWYKISTVRRRVERRMKVHQAESPVQYVRFLEANPHELDLLFRELLISVTSFFRDPEAFKVLKSELAKVLASHRHDRPLRIWVPGCATGEEAYSIGMVVAELAEQQKAWVGAQIFGTDLDAQAVEFARAGLYPQGVAANVGRTRLARFFVPEDSHYRINKEIREMMVFAAHNVIKDPPFTKLDLISCRNVLMYLHPEMQQRLVPLFHYALVPGGLLMLGTSETTGNCDGLFSPIDRIWKLYRRGQGAPRAIARSAVHTARQPLLSRSSSHVPPSGGAPSVSAGVEKLLLERAPPTVIINHRGDIAFIHGKTGAYLEPSPGEPSSNLFTMARHGLRTELSSAVRRASAQDDEVVHRGVVVGDDDHLLVDVRVQKIDDPESLRGLFRVTFEPSAVPRERTKSRPGQRSPRGLRVERELAQTRDTLHGTIEALQGSNEELKSSNEELQSTNEELQSANEELETSKEELQSLNEELQTVNAELQTKMDELARANDDMQNLLDSTAIATLFLDRDLRIKRFTNQAREIIRLVAGDVGRSIDDIVSHLRYDRLIADARRVLETLTPHEAEVQTNLGEWRLLRMLPYRTSLNVIDGVVVTLVDIDRVKRAELLASSREFAQSIVQTVREPLLVLDTDFRILSANQAFFRAFQLEPRHVENHSLFEIGNGLLGLPRLRELLQDIVSHGGTFQDVEIEHAFGETGPRRIVLNARRLAGDAASTGQILLALDDLG